MDARNKDEMKSYMDSQIDEINKHKWIESEKACHDLGESAVIDWIVHHAADFRREWEEKHKTELSGND